MTAEILFCPPVLKVQGSRGSTVSLSIISAVRKEGGCLERKSKDNLPPSFLLAHYRVSICCPQECWADGRAEKNAYLIIFF